LTPLPKYNMKIKPQYRVVAYQRAYSKKVTEVFNQLVATEQEAKDLHKQVRRQNDRYEVSYWKEIPAKIK